MTILRCLLLSALMAIPISGCVGSLQDAEMLSGCSNRDGSVSVESQIDHCTALLKSKDLSSGTRSLVLASRGSAYVQLGGYDRGIQDLDQAIELQPKLAVAFMNRGNAYFKKGAYDRAIQDYDRTIELQPGSASAFLDRGNAYLHTGMADRAIQDYDQAIKLNGNLAFAFENRGGAYMHKRMFDRAIQDYDQALTRKPGVESTYVYKSGLSRIFHGYDRGSGLESDPASALVDRGDVYARQAAYDRAIQDYDQAIKLRPDYLWAFISRGIAYEQQGLYDRAIRDFDGVIKLAPDNSGRLQLPRNRIPEQRRLRSRDRGLQSGDQARTRLCHGSQRPLLGAGAGEQGTAGGPRRLQRIAEAASRCPGNADSRAFVWLRMARYEEAIGDADAALQGDPKLASSLFIHGLARRRRGDPAGDLDLAAARSIDPEIDKTFSRLGVRP